MSWGIEATHEWDGSIVLNDLTTWPMARVRKIDGLRDLAEMEAPADALANRRGEMPRAAMRGGRTAVYSGTLQARTLSDLRTLEEDMLAAFDTNVEKDMVITPDAAYASGSRKFSARAMALSISDEQTRSPQRASGGHERDFVLTLRLSDPRIYDPTVNTNVSSSGSAAKTNLVTNPRAGALTATGWTLTSMVAFAPISIPFMDGLPIAISTCWFFWGNAASDRATIDVPVTNAVQYTASAYIANQQGAGGIALQVRRADGTTVVGTSTVITTVGGFTRVSVTFTAAATESYKIGFIQNAAAATQIGYVTGLQVEAGAAASDYFDGDSPASSWAGSAHASASTRRAVRSKVITVVGTLETDPVVTLAGDGTDLAIRHKELDKWIALGTNDLAVGQNLVIDFKERTVMLNGVYPAPHWIDRALTDWWDEGVPGLISGTNTIEYYRTGAGEVSVDHYDAYPA